MLSTDNKNSKILALTLSALVVGVKAQTVTCTTASPQCCWVVRSWQLMGKAIPTGIKSTDRSCCTVPMAGVTCDSTKTKVTGLDWSFKSLTGSIPSEIGNLVDLTNIYFISNQLSGSIPASIGNLKSLTNLQLPGNQLSGPIPSVIGKLVNLQFLFVNNNKLSGSIPSSIGNLTSLFYLSLYDNQFSGSIPASIGNLKNLNILHLYSNQLSGPIPSEIGKLVNLLHLYLFKNQFSGSIPLSFRNLTSLMYLYIDSNPLSGIYIPNCLTKVSATNTSVTLCGCATTGSPANLFPAAGTSPECLSTGPASPLAKRALVFSQNIGAFKYTCNNDPYGNPYQDCLNAQGAICNTTYISGNQSRIDNCKKGVDQMTRSLSSFWQNVRKSCGQWSFDGAVKGSSTSLSCSNANNALQQNAFYLLPDGTKGPVTSSFTNSVTSGLWSKII